MIKPVHFLINISPIATSTNKETTMVHLYSELITISTYIATPEINFALIPQTNQSSNLNPSRKKIKISTPRTYKIHTTTSDYHYFHGLGVGLTHRR